MKNETWSFVVIYNLSLMILIGLSIWVSKSLVPLVALVFSLKYSQKS